MGDESERVRFSAATATVEQMRVLCFLAKYPRWHSLIELDHIRILEADDVICVPSLVECGLVEHQASIGCVRITPAGQVIAGEAKSDAE